MLDIIERIYGSFFFLRPRCSSDPPASTSGVVDTMGLCSIPAPFSSVPNSFVSFSHLRWCCVASASSRSA